MIRSTLTALAVTLTIGTFAAQAQSTDNASVHVARSSAGTIGAMEMVAQGIATSPQDVAAQQDGWSTAADGNRPLTHRAAASGGASPGTVGATPGNDAVR